MTVNTNLQFPHFLQIFVAARQNHSYGVMKYGVMKKDVMKYDVMKYDVMKYDIMKYDVMKYGVIIWRHETNIDGGGLIMGEVFLQKSFP